MKVGFSEDEGWWAVGAHLFLMIIMGVVVSGIADSVFGLWFSNSSLASFLTLPAGLWLGDSIFHEARRRYLRRRQRAQQPAPDGSD
jgi:hypothetical protein